MDKIMRAVALADAPRRLMRTKAMQVPAHTDEAAPAATVAVQVAEAQTTAACIAAATLSEEERASLRAEMELELAREREALRRHADALAEEAYALAEQRGFAAGEEKGLAAGGAALQAEAKRLASISGELVRARDTFLATAEEDAVELAFTALCQMVGASVADRAQVGGMVHHWLEVARASRAATVRLHPDDFRLIMATKDEDTQWGETISFSADREIGLGGCVVETTQGVLDGRLETHLDRLKQVLLSTRAARRDTEAK